LINFLVNKKQQQQVLENFGGLKVFDRFQTFDI